MKKIAIALHMQVGSYERHASYLKCLRLITSFAFGIGGCCLDTVCSRGEMVKMTGILITEKSAAK